MTKIASILDDLAVIRETLAKVQTTIEDCAPADLITYKNQLKAQAASLEADVKQRAECIPNGRRRTLAGRFLQLEYRPHGKGGQWQDDLLADLATEHNIEPTELEACRAPWQHSWSIVKTAGKK
jgi:hypothetical protein